MKKTVIITLMLIVSIFKVDASCVELTIDKHIGGDPICRLNSGQTLEICLDEKTVRGGSCTFYIIGVEDNVNGMTLQLALDKVNWAPKYAELMINTVTQKIGFLLTHSNNTGVYSYFNESQKKQIQNSNKIIKDNEDAKIVAEIKLAVSKQEYYKANSLESKASAGRIDRDLRLIYESEIRKEKVIIDKLYADYKSDFLNKKKEYQANFDAFITNNTVNISRKVIEIDGINAYNKVFKPSFNSEKENARINNLEENRFKCKKVNGKFLISSKGFNGLYYNEVYENQNFDEIKINPRYDSVSNNFYVTLDFNKNDTLRYQGIFDGVYEFNSSVYTLPYPSDLKLILDKIQSQGDRYTLEHYPILTFSFGKGESIPIKNLSKVEFEEEKSDYEYDKLCVYSNQNGDNFRVKDQFKKTDVKSKEFYNPLLKLLIKRLHPEFDSIIMVSIGDKHYPESDIIFDKLGLVVDGHIGNHYKKFIILPLKKGSIECYINSNNKTNLLRVFINENKYQEFFVDLEEQSIASIKNISIDNLIIDSSFVPKRVYKYINRLTMSDKEFLTYQFLFNYGELKYNFSRRSSELSYRFLYNDLVSIQLVQLTKENSMIGLQLDYKYDQNYAYRVVGLSHAFNNTSYYLYKVLQCLRYKNEGDLKKYNKEKIKLENWK